MADSLSSEWAATPQSERHDFSSTDIEQLEDELMFQQAIRESLLLLEAPSEASHQQLTDAEEEIRGLKSRLSSIRESQRQSSRTRFDQTDDTGSALNRVRGRNASSSSTAASSRMSSPSQLGGESQSDSANANSRKRAFSKLGLPEADSTPEIKSRRTTPTPSSSNHHFGDSEEYFDLTNWPEEDLLDQQQALESYKKQKDDEALARQLQSEPEFESPPPSALSFDDTPRASAFDRIQGRSFAGTRLDDEQSGSGIISSTAGARSGNGPMADVAEDNSDPFRSLHPLQSLASSGPSGSTKQENPEGDPSQDLSQLNYNMPGSYPEWNQDAMLGASSASEWHQDPFRSPALPQRLQAGSYSSLPTNGLIVPSQASLIAPQLASRPGQLQNGAYHGSFNTENGAASSSSSALGRSNQEFLYAAFLQGFGPPGPWNDQEDAKKTEEEIKELLANIRPDIDLPEEDVAPDPDALRYPLYPHQRLALKWMQDMETASTKGGILADDMGLGKTISALSLIVSRPSSDPRNKTNLIVGPVALIRQWQSEIKKKLRSGRSLSVYLLHGKKTTFEELRSYDVVLTSYGVIGSELRRIDKWIIDHPGGNPCTDKDLHSKCPVVHDKSTWFRVILDEAQCIKNKDTQGSRAVAQITATYRWCLTGTPMMNGCHELYPLLRFLRIKPYSDQKKFNRDFAILAPKASRNSEITRTEAMRRFRAVIKATMLRRLKDSKINGQPILNLPGKTEEIIHVEFSADEHAFYSELQERTQVQFSKYLRAGTVTKNYSNILVLLLRLRQACCHPHLNMDYEQAGSVEGVGESLGEETMIELAKSLGRDVVMRIKEHDAFECPICFDVAVNPSLVIPCGHDMCMECLQRLTDSSIQANIRNGNESRDARCPECRGPLDPKKIIDYEVFKQVHLPKTAAAAAAQAARRREQLDVEEDSDSEDGDSSDLDSTDEDDNEDADERGNLRGFVLDEDDGESLGGGSHNDSEIGDLSQAVLSQQQEKKKERSKSKKSKGKGKEKEKIQPHRLALLRKEASRNQEKRRQYMRYLRKNWMPSAKISKACELLEEIQKTGEKTIIFSLWTSLLDLLEVAIKYQLKLKYCRFDGGMSAAQRDEAARTFNEDSLNKVMLVSLKAGNAGLNLTAASRVIIMDPFWNPFIEMQAIDRAYRIGQLQPVKVYRILVESTVEDRIIELQDQKRELVNAAYDEKEIKSLGRLSAQQLGHLFGVNVSGAR